VNRPAGDVTRAATAGHPAPTTQGERSGGGWFLVWALAIAQLVSWGSIYYGFSLFVVPMETDLGWSRTAINGALSFGLLTSGLFAYPAGAWIDRHGGRLVMSFGSALGAALLAAWSRIDSIAVLYAIWFGLGLAMAASLYEPVFAVVTRSFPHSYRTRITALTLIGGFASTVFIPATQLLIDWYGWRDALVALAVCVAAVCLPVHALLLRDGDSGGAAEAPSVVRDTGETAEDALRRALRHPVFWALAVCFTAYYAAFSAMTFHIIPLLTERGVPTATIIAAIAVIGPAQVAGRIVLLAFGPRLPTAAVGRAVMLALVVSFLVLIVFPASIAALFVFAAIYGAANGLMTIIRGMAVPDLMWREGYGAINGALTFPSNVAKAIAPFGAALLWDGAGNYDTVLWWMTAGAAVAALAFWYAAAAASQRPQEATP
jgi:predicted MFS family arabinose efflux permease